MPLLRLVLCIAALAAGSSAHAGAVVVVGSGAASGVWLALGLWASTLPRPVPEVSPHHIGAEPATARAANTGTDACTFVAGVRHCPLRERRAGPQ